MADTLDLGSSAERRGGSSPFIRTKQNKSEPKGEDFFCLVFFTFNSSFFTYYKTSKQGDAVKKVIDMSNSFEDKISKVNSEEEQALLNVYKMIQITEEASKFLSIEDQLRLIRDFGDSGGARAFEKEFSLKKTNNV